MHLCGFGNKYDYSEMLTTQSEICNQHFHIIRISKEANIKPLLGRQ